MTSVHKKKKSFQCGICYIRFSRNYSLTKHTRTIHNPKKSLINKVKQDEIHKCEICDFFCNKKGVIRIHINSFHRGLKQLKSGIFLQLFLQKSDLNQHIKQVHGEKKAIKCWICEFETLQKKSLNRHIKYVHHRKKPFKCDICEKCFFQKSETLKHKESVHSQIKKFCCELCETSFTKIGLPQGNRYFILRPNLHQSSKFPL